MIKMILIFKCLLFCSVITRGICRHITPDHRMHPIMNFHLKPDIQKRAMPMLDFQPLYEREKSAEYWQNIAKNTLDTQLRKNKLNLNVPKNVIMFLGDGMSIPTLAATRVYLGGEEMELSFEKFPYVGLSKTYCVNTQVADSACTATAYLGGVKGNFGTIGLTAAVDINNCLAQNNTDFHVPSIAAWAQAKGLATGLITTTSVTHASPAGVYAHIASRNWENDAEIRKDGQDPGQCADIAHQLIHDPVGQNLNVIMGGGMEHFLPIDETDAFGGRGKREDNKNLIDKWMRLNRRTGAFVQNKQQLNEVPSSISYLLGLFGTSHMPFHLDADDTIIPSLSDMVEKALDMFQSQKRGYFLFVEGGRIDHAHHDTLAVRALDETTEFQKAIDLARNRTNLSDTLIVVTSDHSHTMSISGYAKRKNDIFGVSSQLGEDQLTYATLNYANGPGYHTNIGVNGRRVNLMQTDMSDKDFKFPATVPLGSETHAGDDVGVYASGPHAHLFSGVYEQNYIPYAIGYATCWGEHRTVCNDGKKAYLHKNVVDF